jgi:hypothetical protein
MKTCKTAGVKWSDADVINPEEYIPEGEYNPQGIHGFVLHDHGFVVAVVLASHLQDAIDIAVDEDKMKRYAIDSETLMSDYDEEDREGGVVSYLGNAGEPHDIQTLGVVELHNSKRKLSFAALYEDKDDLHMVKTWIQP